MLGLPGLVQIVTILDIILDLNSYLNLDLTNGRVRNNFRPHLDLDLDLHRDLLLGLTNGGDRDRHHISQARWRGGSPPQGVSGFG